jgi:tau tubulin kinase
MTEESGEDELGIRSGVVIDTPKNKFVILELLGEGGFGAVYKAHLEGDKSKEFAIKVEKKTDKRKHSKLKMEIAILKLVSSLRAERSHFTKIIDRGKKPGYFFLVMQLVGKSLADLKGERRDKVFSIATGLGVSLQCLEAVEDLHTQGYIHRDLKPANYACGLTTQTHVIYILDFGIARKITKDAKEGAEMKSELKTPRSSVGFKGTVRFASLACHKNEDMGKKDDCESWHYLLMDLIISTGLPWRRLTNKDDVRDSKMNSRKEGQPEFNSLYANIPKCKGELVKIIAYIDGLAYVETPDYEFMYKMLREAAASSGVNIDAPFDWEEPEPKTKRQNLQKAKN